MTNNDLLSHQTEIENELKEHRMKFELPSRIIPAQEALKMYDNEQKRPLEPSPSIIPENYIQITLPSLSGRQRVLISNEDLERSLKKRRLTQARCSKVQRTGMENYI